MDLWDAVAVAEQMSTAELLAAAQREVGPGQDDAWSPHLVALQNRPTPEVFDAAVRLLSSGDAQARELGVTVLRELGRPDENGRRGGAFADGTAGRGE